MKSFAEEREKFVQTREKRIKTGGINEIRREYGGRGISGGKMLNFEGEMSGQAGERN
jgi:hypothetical protein